MSEPLLAALVAGVLMASLNAYVVLGGADFGGGVWDLLASGPRRGRQRALIADAIGPIWEANHVWLILVVVLLFSCFPPVFTRVSITLHIPLALMLVGIVLRGSAFTFRSYDSQRDDVQRRWGAVFAGASTVTPLLLGVIVGTVAAGRVPLAPSGSFAHTYVSPWLAPFPFSVGFLAVVLFAFLAAVYLTLETSDAELQEDFRRRALRAGVAVFGAAALSLGLAYYGAPRVWQGLVGARWAVLLHLAIGIAALAALWGLWHRRWQLARAAAVVQVSGIVWGWGLAQYPYLLPPDLSYVEAAAPAITLKLVLVALALGAIVLIPSLYYLFRIFKSRPT